MVSATLTKFSDLDGQAPFNGCQENFKQPDGIGKNTGRKQRLSAHDVLFYEGDKAERLYEVLRGVMMLYKLLPDGRRQVVYILREGDMLGFSNREFFDCTAEALTEVELQVFESREISTSPMMQHYVNRCLLSQMETLHEHTVLLGRKSALERVSTFLMSLVPNRGGHGCSGPIEEGKPDTKTVALSMTRQEIADYLGLTIETVSRVISQLKRRGLIKVEKQDSIHITNICGICQLTGMH
ncbi:Nitrogen fixation regulation protein FixK [Pseudovibrio axinellae]|uniref:Nitrogen fixation regulation protein FixK n=1 Tax=Pseudovibrio axinellae TaxID=989403 RepID=A0A165YL56_9HYPH|nr:helix-turn-helix domain-containing protein [Pseudovibrio axinellae]KZL18942.1 Nitrogen fixation regulation protein FixK [Pseudovibrio axinellae]SEP86841.1 CRP/FNR family transcriptional regulator, anaerobic regulatory protein [Pseudovibrio axinellae]